MDHYFFLNDTATTEIYTLSLHDALPISGDGRTEHLGQPGRLLLVRRLRHDVLGGSEGRTRGGVHGPGPGLDPAALPPPQDRKSTRLNSSHANISYAVFCLKKKHTVYDAY